MLFLPPHTSHRLQPLDVTFFKQLGTYYNQAAEKWLRANPDSNITQTRIAGLLGESYGRAATIQNAVSGFSKTGIWPLDPNIFQDSDFVPTMSESEGRAEKQGEHQIPNSASATTKSSNLESSNDVVKVTPQQLSPIPTLQKRKRSRVSSSTVVITSSPYKNSLANKKAVGESSKKCLKLELSESSASWYCKICKENKEEDIIKCLKCCVWFHTSCAKVSAKKKCFIVMSVDLSSE